MLFLYLRTTAPGITLWDSSEIAACAAIMGIPHPPGSPLLILLGRVMAIVPFYDLRGGGFESIAYRINLIAVISGAFAAMLSYLITVKLIARTAPFRGMLRYDGFIMFAGLIAAFLTGLSPLFWENAVQIETYMPALMISMLAVFLALIWEERSDDPRCARYLFCAVYLVGLGAGIHMSVLLIAPVIFLIVLNAKPSWFSNVRLLVTLVLAAAALYLARGFITPGIVILSALFLWLIVPVLFVRQRRNNDAPAWKKTLLGLILCLSLFSIGYSVYPTVMIRASKDPAINVGNPDNIERFRAYHGRDQYGQGNMLSGIFNRNASAGYQFKYMYFRYFLAQFPDWGPSPKIAFPDYSAERPDGKSPGIHSERAPVFLLFLLLCGMCVHLRADMRRFGIFFAYFFVSSAGLVLYLNMENPQVRERGYFYLGSFQIMMLWVGFGVYGVISFVRSRLSTRFLTPVTAVMILVFITLVPAALLTGRAESGIPNYLIRDRSRDNAAHEFAVNVLESCGANAILFTHGDNDTYPLWYVQHAEGFRRDVSVINLSILNAPWYIKQLRDKVPAGLTEPIRQTTPIELTDSFIDRRLSGGLLSTFKTLVWTPEPKEVTAAGMTWNMPPSYVTDDKESGFLSVSQYMVLHIIETNDRARPVCFSMHVDPANMIGLYEYMTREGLLYCLK